MDEILNWHWWMYIAVLFFIIEVFTPGFIVACLGLGSLVAAITAYMGYNIDAQFISFSVSTLISLFLIRPLLYKKGEKQDKIKTNTEALIGQLVLFLKLLIIHLKMIEPIIDGDQWKAISQNNQIIELNAQVEVISIDSTVLRLKKYNMGITIIILIALLVVAFALKELKTQRLKQLKKRLRIS